MDKDNIVLSSFSLILLTRSELFSFSAQV